MIEVPKRMENIKKYYEEERTVYIVEPVNPDTFIGFTHELSSYFKSDQEALDYAKGYSNEVGVDMMVTKEIRKGEVIAIIRGW